MMRDIDKQVSHAMTIDPQASITATTTGTGVDLTGYRSAAVVLHMGAIQDGTWTPTVEESDVLGSGYTTVAAADLSGSFAAITTANDVAVYEVGYLGSKQYIRLVMTETVASAGAFFSATVMRGNPVSGPV